MREAGCRAVPGAGAGPSASWRSGGCSRRQITPRLISFLARANRPYKPRFRQRVVPPTKSEVSRPALVLSQIYEQEGDKESQLQWLEMLLENLQHDFGSAMILAQAALDESDFERANYYLDRALQVDPYRNDVHELKARFAKETGNNALAVTEYEVLMSLEVNDPVEAQTNLAEAYLSNGQLSEAKQSILRALEIAPSFQRAQQILLQTIGEGSD